MNEREYISASEGARREIGRREIERGVRTDRVIAGIISDAGDLVSGLDLTAIGEDGHLVANRLWKIAAYLRRRKETPE